MKATYPYGKQSISRKDIQAVIRVLKSDWLTQGPVVEQFERAVADYVEAKYAVAVANGTAALHLAVLALDLEPGFEGITSTMTFVASANCILYGGGRVRLVDIDPKTALLDVNQLKKTISKKTRLIIPVHYAGQSCDMVQVGKLAKKHGLYVIEDAAHAIGSEYRGKKVGSCQFSDMAIFSFHPVKTMTTAEGGIITTNDPKLYRRLKLLRTHGITKEKNEFVGKEKNNQGGWYYQMQELGFNYRMTELQAALGLSQLKSLPRFAQKRRQIVEWYRRAFDNDDRFSLIEEAEDSKAAWHLCPLLVDWKKVKIKKAEAFESLRERGLTLQVHYIPVHLQPYYQKLGFYSGQYPQAEAYYKQTISLPLYPSLNKQDLKAIVAVVRQVLI